jgi:hypothetical protein
MFAAVEAFARRLRRRLSRSEWAIRHLGLTPSTGTSEELRTTRWPWPAK